MCTQKQVDDATALVMLPVMIVILLVIFACAPTATEGWLIPFVGTLPK